MFEAAASLGGLDVQLVYFRGLNECRASNFVSGGQGLAELMSRIDVRGGSTQIRQGARPCARRGEARQGRRRSSSSATRWRRTRTGSRASPASSRCSASRRSCSRRDSDPAARRTFSEIARLTGGAYGAFDAGASARLAALLRAAAAYAAGGHAALVREAEADPAARLLLSQMRNGRELGVVSSQGARRRLPAPRRFGKTPVESKALQE